MVLGASFDTVETNKAFAEEFDLPFLLLCDTGRDLAMKYGAATSETAAHARRISYLIDPEGVIANAYANVNPQTHAEQVLADLAAHHS